MKFLSPALCNLHLLEQTVSNIHNIRALESGVFEYEFKNFSVMEAIKGVLKKLHPFSQRKQLRFTIEFNSEYEL